MFHKQLMLTLSLMVEAINHYFDGTFFGIASCLERFLRILQIKPMSYELLNVDFAVCDHFDCRWVCVCVSEYSFNVDFKSSGFHHRKLYFCRPSANSLHCRFKTAISSAAFEGCMRQLV